MGNGLIEWLVRLLPVLSSIIGAIITSGYSSERNMSGKDNVLELRDTILLGDFTEQLSMLENIDDPIIIFGSKGGSLSAAISFAQAVNDVDATLYVKDFCFSACVEVLILTNSVIIEEDVVIMDHPSLHSRIAALNESGISFQLESTVAEDEIEKIKRTSNDLTRKYGSIIWRSVEPLCIKLSKLIDSAAYDRGVIHTEYDWAVISPDALRDLRPDNITIVENSGSTRFYDEFIEEVSDSSRLIIVEDLESIDNDVLYYKLPICGEEVREGRSAP